MKTRCLQLDFVSLLMSVKCHPLFKPGVKDVTPGFSHLETGSSRCNLRHLPMLVGAGGPGLSSSFCEVSRESSDPRPRGQVKIPVYIPSPAGTWYQFQPPPHHENNSLHSSASQCLKQKVRQIMSCLSQKCWSLLTLSKLARLRYTIAKKERFISLSLTSF